MARLKNRLPILMAEYRMKSGERLSLTRLAELADVSRDTLSSMVNDPETAISSNTITAVCKFFKIQPGDLLFIEYAPGELDELNPQS
jgi:DNA-binding Xre family transcriptional regulator